MRLEENVLLTWCPRAHRTHPFGVLYPYTCAHNVHNAPSYIFGDFLQGHWLSATAMVVEGTGSAAAKTKNAEIVTALAGAQAAWTGIGQAGYLFPYSLVAWDNLFADPPRNCDPVCVPWYVYHKVLQGMIDSYTRAGNAQALTVAIGMAAWTKQAIEAVLARGGEGLWQRVLGTEWGGMNDGLYNLYNITGNKVRGAPIGRCAVVVIVPLAPTLCS